MRQKGIKVLFIRCLGIIKITYVKLFALEQKAKAKAEAKAKAKGGGFDFNMLVKNYLAPSGHKVGNIGDVKNKSRAVGTKEKSVLE